MLQIFTSRPPIQYVIESFDSFLENDIPTCLERMPLIESPGHAITFGNHKIFPPSHNEPKCEPYIITGTEVIARHLTYHSILQVDVFDNKKLLCAAQFLGYVPMMVGSKYGNPDPKWDDYGGYFVVKGNKQICIAQEQLRSNAPIYMPIDGGWTCHVMSESSPARLRLILGPKGGVFVLMLNHMTNAVSLATFVRALGGGSLHDLLATDDLVFMKANKNTFDQIPDPDVHAALLPLMTFKNNEYVKDKVRHSLSYFLLPHVGTTPDADAQKLFWILQWARYLLELTSDPTKKCTDRDHLCNKRAKLVGSVMEELMARGLAIFAKNMNELLKKTRAGPDADIRRMIQTVNSVITTTFSQPILTGNLGKGRNGVFRPYEGHKSELAGLLGPRHTNAFLANTNKLRLPRMLHGSHYGFICPAESPGGDTIGFLKSPTVTCEISSRDDDFTWRDAIAACAQKWAPSSKQLILWNGRIAGIPRVSLRASFDHLKRHVRNVPPYHATVNLSNNMVILETSAGRWVRPLYIAGIQPPAPHFKLEELIQQGFIEYIDPSSDVVIATDITNVTPRTTHIEIHPSFIFGFSGGRVPYADHDMAPRITFQAEMATQALGWPTLANNWENNHHTLNYGQRPSATTLLERLMDPMPSGANCIIGILPLANGQEDALGMSESALDLGLLRTVTYKVIDEVETPPYTFCAPPEGRQYIKVDRDGSVFSNIRINPDDIIFCKRHENVIIPVYYRGTESGIVDKVMLTTTIGGLRMFSVRIRFARKIEIGDKFASRHGQKGTVSMFISRADLPYTSSGMTPDVVLNPHAIPSRMTIGHLIETLACKAGTVSEYEIDATPFGNFEWSKLEYCLKRAGYQKHGNETMYCGKTGRMYRVPIYMGNCFYQRLKHMVVDKIHARATGPHCNLTRQPVGGRVRKGAFRLGNMEVDGLLAHGTAFFLNERMVTSSNGVKVAWCQKCGCLARCSSLTTANYVCSSSTCDSRDFKIGIMPYAMLLLIGELRGTGVAIYIK